MFTLLTRIFKNFVRKWKRMLDRNALDYDLIDGGLNFREFDLQFT